MTTQTPQSYATAPGDDQASAPSGTGTSARDRAAQVGGTARDEAAGVAQEATRQARDLVGDARQQVGQQLDVQRGRISELLRDLGDELDQMADGSERDGVAAELARMAAARTRDVRGYLDGEGDLLGDVRRFARRRPGTFLLGALAAGVLAGRATRAATATRRGRDHDRDDPRGGPGDGSTSGTATWGGAEFSTAPGAAAPPTPPVATPVTTPGGPPVTRPGEAPAEGTRPVGAGWEERP